MKKMKLLTFADIHHSPKRKFKDSVKSVDSDRQLFAKLLVISNDRKIDLQRFFEYELSSYPLAIANADGSLTICNKAQTLRDLEAIADASQDPNTFAGTIATEKHFTATFIDHMACLQKMASRTGVQTFGDLADGLQKIVENAFRDGDTVHVVSDRYGNELSIKAGERKRRGQTIESPEVKIRSRDQALPRNMKAYLSNPKNKDNINDFTFEEWIKKLPDVLTADQSLVLSGGFKNHERVVEIRNGKVMDLPELYSTQEEADSRIFLHVHNSVTRYNTQNAIIWSPDTDVLVLGTWLAEELGIKLWFKTGTKFKTRYVPLHVIAEKLGSSEHKLLLALHTLTGCDSTSCFKGKGKHTALQILHNNNEKFHKLAELGDSFDVGDEVINACLEFVCRLYEPRSHITDINTLRYKQFCKQAKKNYCLPPCKNSLIQHIKRANYQCKVWKSALSTRPFIASPEGHGWIVTDEGLEPQFMTQDSGPRELAELTTCKCTKSRCASRQCKCANMELSCTPACSCEGDANACDNIDDTSDDDISGDHDVESDDEAETSE